MRHAIALVVLAALSGCASTEYSKVPEPSGEWVPANPVSLMTMAAPRPVVRRAVWRRRARVVPAIVRPAVPAPVPTLPPASDKVAAQ